MEIGLRMLGAVLKLFDFLTWPLYFIMSLKSHKKMAPIDNVLLKQSATSLARQIRHGEVKSEDVVKAFVSRMREVNPLLNALVEDRFAAAIDDARDVDQLVASRRKTPEQLEKETPLLGVPFTVKESCGLQGLSQAVGSLTRKGMKADHDGEAVKNMKKSGAIPIAVTNTPELCFSWETNNFVTGLTRNPFDPNRTSGGSSGGEAALLGAGASVIGVASDIAGSIRIPAMYNGIFGHKPSPGIVSVIGHFPYMDDPDFRKFLAVGPLTRYAEDLRPMVKAMAGENASSLRLDEKVDLPSLKVFFMDEAGKSLVAVDVEPEIKQALHSAVNYLHTKHGIVTQKADIKEMEISVEIACGVFFGLQEIPNLLAVENDPKKSHNLYLEMLKSALGLSRITTFALGFYLLVQSNGFISKKKFPLYCKLNENLRQKFVNLLKTDGVFIYPTHPTPALFHGQSLTRTAGVMYTMIFNVLGLPSTHVPLGLNKDGLPIGIQVVAAPLQDRLCLAVAEELEKQFGGWVPPPSI